MSTTFVLEVKCQQQQLNFATLRFHKHCQHLHQQSGRKVVVWNRSESKSNELLQEFGGDLVTVASSPKEVVDQCQLTYSMLSTLDACESVFRSGPNPVMEGLTSPGKSIVNMATLTAEYMRGLAEDIEGKGCKYLEAPVSGSKVR